MFRPSGLYVAELFRPGEKKPFRQQTAGRELFDPSVPLPLGEMATATRRTNALPNSGLLRAN